MGHFPCSDSKSTGCFRYPPPQNAQASKYLTEFHKRCTVCLFQVCQDRTIFLLGNKTHRNGVCVGVYVHVLEHSQTSPPYTLSKFVSFSFCSPVWSWGTQMCLTTQMLICSGHQPCPLTTWHISSRFRETALVTFGLQLPIVKMSLFSLLFSLE